MYLWVDSESKNSLLIPEKSPKQADINKCKSLKEI